MGVDHTFLHGGWAWDKETPLAGAHTRGVLAGISFTARGHEDHHAVARGGRIDLPCLVASEEDYSVVAPMGARKVDVITTFSTPFNRLIDLGPLIMHHASWIA